MLDLSDFQRGQIVGASRAGVSVTQASQLLGVLELESTLLTRTFTAEQQCPSHLSQMLKPNIVNSGVTLTRPGQLISERREPHTFNPYLASFSLGGIFPQLSYPFFLLYGESFYYPPPIDPPCPGLATRNSEVVRRPSNGRNNYRGNYENGRQGNQWFESRNRFQKDDRRLNDRGYQFRNGSQKDDFSRGGYRNRGSSLIINKEGIKTDETKVRAIVVMKPPRNSKDVSKFLGMSQWYAKFVKNYADVCETLYKLKQKLKKFCWSIEAQKAFHAVKAAITKAPALKGASKSLSNYLRMLAQ
ncbi:uncharacterized protein TNCV_898073 [Trichonephila clavipes]|nr:uncharacterized protein TNCV_898073 [Trichonephila clavipes]